MYLYVAGMPYGFVRLYANLKIILISFDDCLIFHIKDFLCGPNRRKKGDLKSISFPLRMSDCLLFTDLAQEIMDKDPLDVRPLPYYLDWRRKL